MEKRLEGHDVANQTRELTAATLAAGAVPNRSARFLRRSSSSASTSSAGGAARLLRPLGFVGAALAAGVVDAAGAAGALVPKRAARAASFVVS